MNFAEAILRKNSSEQFKEQQSKFISDLTIAYELSNYQNEKIKDSLLATTTLTINENVIYIGNDVDKIFTINAQSDEYLDIYDVLNKKKITYNLTTGVSKYFTVTGQSPKIITFSYIPSKNSYIVVRIPPAVVNPEL